MVRSAMSAIARLLFAIVVGRLLAGDETLRPAVSRDRAFASAKH